MCNRLYVSACVIMLIFVASSCRFSKVDSFAPKRKVYSGQFKFSSAYNAVVKKSTFSGTKGKYKDSFSMKRIPGSGGGGFKDSFSIRRKKSGAGRFHDSYSSRPRQKTGGWGFKDSFSFKRNASKGSGRFRDSFSVSRNRSKSGGNFGYDSFSVRKRTSYGFNFFSGSKKRVVSSLGKKNPRSHDSFSFKRKNKSGGGENNETFTVKKSKKSYGNFSFNKNKKKVTAKNNNNLNASRSRWESGSFSVSGNRRKGQFLFNENLGIMIKRNISEKSFNRNRASNAFNSGRKKIRSTSVYKEYAHRNLIRRAYKPKDTDPGSFGGKKVKKATGQFRYSKNKRSVKKRDGFFYDLFGVFKEKNKKKKEPEMDLFDKKMKKNLKF